MVVVVAVVDSKVVLLRRQGKRLESGKRAVMVAAKSVAQTAVATTRTRRRTETTCLPVARGWQCSTASESRIACRRERTRLAAAAAGGAVITMVVAAAALITAPRSGGSGGRVRAVPGGDASELCIAVASLFAKIARDAAMRARTAPSPPGNSESTRATARAVTWSASPPSARCCRVIRWGPRGGCLRSSAPPHTPPASEDSTTPPLDLTWWGNGDWCFFYFSQQRDAATAAYPCHCNGHRSRARLTFLRADPVGASRASTRRLYAIWKKLRVALCRRDELQWRMRMPTQRGLRN